MIARPAYWEEVAKQAYADGEDRALPVAEQFAAYPARSMIDSLTVSHNWRWFYELWEQKYWHAKDGQGNRLIPEDMEA